MPISYRRFEVLHKDHTRSALHPLTAITAITAMFTATNIPEPIQHSLKRHFPEQRLFGFEPTFGGFSNWTQLAILEEQRLIVKAAMHPTKRLDIRREAAALKYLSGTDISIAKVYALDEDEDWTILLLEVLPGINGLKLLEQAPDLIVALYQQLGTHLARLHRHAPPEHPLLHEAVAQRALTSFEEYKRSIPQHLRHGLDDGLHAMSELPASQLIHGDPGAHNLLWDNKLTGLLDWEWSGRGHALIDLAWLKWTLRFRKLGQAVWDAFCAGYGTMPEHDEGLMQRLALGKMAAILASLPEQPIAHAEWLRRVEWTIGR